MAAALPVRHALDESGCLGLQPQMGGKFHLKLNIGTRPIANKYREGKMKSTLKRELKACETVARDAEEHSSSASRKKEKPSVPFQISFFYFKIDFLKIEFQ